jgi:glutathione S-transferase
LRNGLFAQDAESKKKYFEELEEVLLKLEEVFNKFSEGKDFFGGDQIGFIDIAFGCYLSWLRVKEKLTGTKKFDEAKNPGLVKWAEAFSAHPAVKGILPETDKLVEYAIAMAQGLAAAAAAAAPPK